MLPAKRQRAPDAAAAPPAARADATPEVEIQGHRGFGSLEPHNTLRAFRAAAACEGVRSVEFDVRGTADGRLVVTHGPELPGLESDVESATLGSLQSHDLGHGERMPLLEEVLRTCLEGGLLMNVELKPLPRPRPTAAEEEEADGGGGGGAAAAFAGAWEEATRDFVVKVIALLRDTGALPRCRVSSFDRSMLQHVIRVAPEVPIGALYHPSSKVVDSADASRGMHFALEPPDFASWFSGHCVDGDSVNLRVEAVSAQMVAEARRCGKRVLVWFPCAPQTGFEDEVPTYQRLISMGVDVICCNRPDLAVTAAAEVRSQEASRGKDL